MAVGGLIVMACAMGIGRFIYTPILPPMVEELLLTKGQAGLIASANFAGYLAGALAATVPVAAPRRWLLAMLGASAITTLLMAWPSTVAPFVVLRFLGGVASAFVLVLAWSLVVERLAAAGRADLAAVHFAGVGTGIAVSALLTWALDTAGLGWRAMWLAGGALSFAGTLAAVALIPAAAPVEGERNRSPAAPIAGPSHGLALLATAYGLFGFGYVITATFMVAIIRGSLHARTAEPLIWLVLGLTAIPSVAAWVAAGSRMGVLRGFAAASIVQSVGVALSVLWPTLPGLFLSGALLGGTFMGLTALGLMAARDLAAGSPWAIALMTSAFGLGQIVGPVIAGYGYDLTGSFILPSLIAAAGLVIGAGLVSAIAAPNPR